MYVELSAEEEKKERKMRKKNMSVSSAKSGGKVTRYIHMEGIAVSMGGLRRAGFGVGVVRLVVVVVHPV